MQQPDFKKTDDMFNRVLIQSNIAVICHFENIETGTQHVITNVHICSDLKYSNVKLVQVVLIVDEVETVANNFAKFPPHPPSDGSTMKLSPIYSDGMKIPIIISRDYNLVPGSGVYKFLTNGVLLGDHLDFLSHSYSRYTSDGLRHSLGLKSAYVGISELPSFHGMIDYIWYSTVTLSVNPVLSEVDHGYLKKVVGFLDAHNPSKYVILFFSICGIRLITEFDSQIPIFSKFRVKPLHDSKARPPPVFANPSHA